MSVLRMHLRRNGPPQDLTVHEQHHEAFRQRVESLLVVARALGQTSKRHSVGTFTKQAVMDWIRRGGCMCILCPYPSQLRLVPSSSGHPSLDQILAIPYQGGYKFIAPSMVRRIEAEGDYAHLFTVHDGQVLTRISLSTLENLWGDAGLVRVHRSHMVTERLIRQVFSVSRSTHTLVLDDKTEVPMSRRYFHRLKRQLAA